MQQGSVVVLDREAVAAEREREQDNGIEPLFYAKSQRVHRLSLYGKTTNLAPISQA